MPEFPIEVKSDTGRVIVKVYYTPVNRSSLKSYDAYTVDAGTVGGKRERYARTDLKKALQKAKEVANKIANGNTAALSISNADVELLVKCKQIVAKTGKTLETVATEYVQAMDILAGRTGLVESSRFYVEKNTFSFVPKTIMDLLPDYLKLIEDAEMSDDHYNNANVFLTRASEHFKCHIHILTGVEFSAWIAGLKDKVTGAPLSAQSKRNYWRYLQTFLRSALVQKHLPEDWKGMKGVVLPKIMHARANIYTPEEMTLMLYAAAGHIELPTPEVKAEGKKLKPLTDRQKEAFKELVPYLAIGAFGGVRTDSDTGEIAELDWSDINLKEGLISLSDGSAKVSDRFIEMQPNLKQWLLPYEKKKGPIIPDGLVKRRRLLCQYIGLRWKINGLRKSFISYRLAQTKDVARVADEAGNSPEMIYSRYRKPLPRELGERWFAIFPQKENDVVVNIKDIQPTVEEIAQEDLESMKKEKTA